MSYVQATINVKTVLQYIDAIKNSINVVILSLDRSLKSFINISKADIEKLKTSTDDYRQFNVDPDKALIEMMSLSQKIKKMNIKKANIENMIKKNPEAKEILVLEEKKEKYEAFQSEKGRIKDEIQSIEKKIENKKKEFRELESKNERLLSDNTKMIRELRKARNNTELSDVKNRIKTLRFQLHLDMNEKKIIEKELENKINEYDNIIKDNVTIQISNKNMENRLEDDLINSLNLSSTDDSINNSINEETTITMSKSEFDELQRKYRRKNTMNNDIELLKNDLEFLKQQNEDLKIKNDIIVKFMKTVEIRNKIPLFSPVRRRRKSSNL